MSNNTLFCFVACLALVGCSSKSVTDYTPKEDRARGALSAVLDGWQSSKTEISMGETSVRVADTQRRSGQKLKAYEIVGELPADTGRRYQVKLQLDNPTGEEKAQFVVVGIDPIFVFRQEDYDMATHWDHPMKSPSGGTVQ